MTTYWKAEEIRLLAEHVDSLRNKHICVLRATDASGEAAFEVVDESDLTDEQTARIVFRLNTSDEEAKFSEKRENIDIRLTAKITLAKGQSLDNLNDFDGIFTSLPAIDKFVVPYYARLRSLDRCASGRAQFATNRHAVAVLHLPKSQSWTATIGGDPPNDPPFDPFFMLWKNGADFTLTRFGDSLAATA